MSQLAQLLQRFDERYRRRARGGLYALAGFDLQLRAYLADFAERLAAGDDVRSAGDEFLEAFSDFTRQQGPSTVCVQVKRTLDASAMARAALEFVVIDEFLEEEAPDLRPQVGFEVLGRFSGSAMPSPPSWSDIVLPSDAPDRDRQQARLEALRSEGRLLPPRLDPDPWWRLIAAVHPVLDDPLAFAREALDICVGRGVEPTDADQVRQRIEEAFTKRRWKGPPFPGMAITAGDLHLADTTTREVVVGDVPTLDHLRDDRFMERPDEVTRAIEALDRHLAEREWRQEPQIYTFWVDGRSGNGKSVLLLQLMRDLVVTRDASVIWLDDASESLLEVLQAWAASPEVGVGPWFVFVDDFNAPHKRDSIQFDAIARLVRAHPEIEWPVLVTCGAPEQHQQLRSSGHDEALRIGTWRLEPVDAPERERLKTWFQNRTGEAPRTGGAFEQDEGLMISMVFEMRQGDLRAFGHRFHRRLEGEDLVEALALPLALNRLYIWAPGDWLNEEQADALRRVNQDRDFSILTPDIRFGGYVRLTHPHLSDAIYRAIRARADDIVLARDLANAFARALDSDPAVARRILLRIAESHERLEILAPSQLRRDMTGAWTACEAVESKFAPRELASVWVCWACWAARQPEVAVLLGGTPPLERARAVLTADHEYWGVLWSDLWDCQPSHAGLLADAWAWLEGRCDETNRHWSIVWERLFNHDRTVGGSRADQLAGLAVRWLSANEFDLDWNYVFRAVATQRPDLSPWDSALRLVDELPANRNWAYVYQLVADAGDRFPSQRRTMTASRAWEWLTSPVTSESNEWAFVWQKLLDCRGDLPEEVKVVDLVQQGLQWLEGREDRDDWNFVWRSLVDCRAHLPEGVQVTHLVQAGLESLKGREDRAGWAHVWQKLVDCRGDLPQGVDVSHLLEEGVEWLKGREDRDEWNFVWRKLVDCRGDLPTGAKVTDLLEDGLAWLTGREDRDEWAFVWRKVVDCRDDLPREVEVTGLLPEGLEWLKGREDRDEWNFVWQKLVDCRDHLPQGVQVTHLVQAGLQWLKGREDHPAWTFVWQKLLDCRDHLPQGVQVTHLVQAGLQWLKGREDHPAWTFVWQGLHECRDHLPEGVRARGLHELAWGWLSIEGNRSRGEWDKIYEACARGGFREPEFLEAGVRWLLANEWQPQACGIAEEILKASASLSESHPLVVWTRRWLGTDHSHPYWTPVWAALWGACPAVSTAEVALPWIRSGPRTGAVFFVIRTLAETGRQDMADLIRGWCRSYPHEPWVPVAENALNKGME